MIASALIPIGNRASSVAATSAAMCGTRSTARVPAHDASSRARSSTASIIGAVSLPVNVFCWLG